MYWFPKYESFLIALSSEILLNICLLHSQSVIGTQSQSVGPISSDFGFKPTKIEKVYYERGKLRSTVNFFSFL